MSLQAPASLVHALEDELDAIRRILDGGSVDVEPGTLADTIQIRRRVAKMNLDGALARAEKTEAQRDARDSRIANLRRLLARAHRDLGEARDALFLASIARMGLHAQLHWHEERHGTRAKQEAEEAEFMAESERLDAMTPAERDDLLRADGMDPDEVATRSRWWIGQCLHRAIRRRETVEARDAAIARAEKAELRAKCLDARTDALRAIVSTADRMLGPDDGAHEYPEDVPPLVCIMDMAGESLEGREWCDCGYIEWPHSFRRCEMMKEEDDYMEDYDDE